VLRNGQKASYPAFYRSSTAESIRSSRVYKEACPWVNHTARLQRDKSSPPDKRNGSYGCCIWVSKRRISLGKKAGIDYSHAGTCQVQLKWLTWYLGSRQVFQKAEASTCETYLTKFKGWRFGRSKCDAQSNLSHPENGWNNSCWWNNWIRLNSEDNKFG